MRRNDKFIRPLGPTEQFTDACNVHRNLTLVIAVTLKTERDFVFNEMEEALSRLQKEHIQLQACIKRNYKSESNKSSILINPLKWLSSSNEQIPLPEFWQIEKPIVPLQWVVLNDLDWKKSIFENEVQATFEEGSLLWRAFWVDQTKNGQSGRAGTFVFVAHTAIGDTKGGYFLIDNFLSHFEKEPKMQDTMESIKNSQYENLTWSDTFGIGKFMALSMCPWKNPLLLKYSPPIVPDYTSRMIQYDISKFSKSLLKQTKEKGISLQALFTAAGLAAYHEILGIDKQRGAKIWTTHEANLRIYCRNYDETKGRIYGVMCNYTEDPFEIKRIETGKEFWDLAIKCQTTLDTSLNCEFLGKLTSFFGRMGSPYQMFSKLGINRNPRNDFAVVVQELDSVIKEQSGIQIDNMIATTTAFSMGSPLKHAINAYKGDLNYALFYYGNYISFELANIYGEKTIEYLEIAAGD